MSEESTNPARRDVLKTLSIGAVTGLAGCGQFDTSSSDSPSRTEIPSSTSFTPDTKTDSATSPSETKGPVIEAYDVSTATKAGLLEIKLETTHNENLKSATIQTSIDEVTHSLDGQRDTLETQVNGSPGEVDQVRFMLEDTRGGTSKKSVEQYVRKYDLMEVTRLSLGSVYQPYFGFDTKVPENCQDERIPEVGHYNRPLTFEIFDRHIDQMSGHGVDRIMIEFLGNETGEHVRRFLNSDLIDQVQVEPFYTAAQNLWREGYHSTVDSYKEDLVQPHMSFIRDNILARDNVSIYDGRPVVQMWNGYTWARDYEHDRIMDEWGDYGSFFEEIREYLRVDGANPFFVGGTNWWGHGGYPGGREAELTRQFDATTTWVAGAAWDNDGYASQEEVLEWVEENWKGHREFVDENDMEFVPMVFPGFNELTADGETCWGRPGRRTPRSPDFFDELLDLADEYRTTDMINNSVYNNWAEATHIEPGIFEPGPFGEENYGTEYLEIVQNFQSN